MFGERCSNHASATCIAVTPSESATACSPDDCRGVKPPSGKNGTYAIPCCASESTSASSPRFTMLYMFCTHTTCTIFCASATWVAVTLLRPIWRTKPCCCNSASVARGSAIEPSAGPCALNMMRRLTTSSTSSCRLRRLSCTACVSSCAEKAGSQEASLPRRAPILVTSVRSSRYG